MEKALKSEAARGEVNARRLFDWFAVPSMVFCSGSMGSPKPNLPNPGPARKGSEKEGVKAARKRARAGVVGRPPPPIIISTPSHLHLQVVRLPLCK